MTTWHVFRGFAAGALLLLAVGCTSDGALTSEQRGPLVVERWTDGTTLVADVALAGAEEPLATIECVDGEAGAYLAIHSLGESRALDTAPDSCTPDRLTQLAFLIGHDVIVPASDGGPDGVVYQTADDAGCDAIGGDSICCARHDACYAAYDCNWTSWFYLWGNCARCNDEVIVCLAGE